MQNRWFRSYTHNNVIGKAGYSIVLCMQTRLDELPACWVRDLEPMEEHEPTNDQSFEDGNWEIFKKILGSLA